MAKGSHFQEVNFDGIVGPTHNYSGLSFGNVASTSHKQKVSHPKKAALQGLNKMKFLMDLGVPQAVLPPHDRPDMACLRKVGFSGTDSEVIVQASKEAPELLGAFSSAAAMWTANAATVSPRLDSGDRRTHLTVANLVNKVHRSIEPPTTFAALKKIFSDQRFQVHSPLPAHDSLGDEGAANHTRLAKDHSAPGLHLFVFGRTASPSGPSPRVFPGRQILEASQAVARNHLLPADQVLFVQQNPDAIDAGVFHNDVICVGYKNILFLHEKAFLEQAQAVQRICRAYEKLNDDSLEVVQVSSDEIGLEDVVRSYLFNTQIVTTSSGRALIAPMECQENAAVHAYLSKLTSHTSIQQVHYIDVRESMDNGGGPACLRLRVLLSDDEVEALGASVILDPSLHQRLVDWVSRHYREEIALSDLADPQLLEESRRALDELTQILGLGAIYPFQAP